MKTDMKSGEAVYLGTQPDLRGNVSRVGHGWFEVTWHAFLADRPEAAQDKINLREAAKRMRVRYSKAEAKNIGFGNPDKK